MMEHVFYRLKSALKNWLTLLLIAFASLLVFLFTPDAVKQSVGHKSYALWNIMYWNVRAVQHSEDGFLSILLGKEQLEPEEISGGVLLGVTKAGDFLIRGYDGKETEAQLADVIVDDAAGIAKFMKPYQYEHVVLDIYYRADEALHIVRLSDGTPVNLLLIENQLAHAQPTPPTSIVDRMMAIYWSNVFKGDIEYVK